MEDPVVVVELPEGGRGRVVLDSAAGSGGVGAAGTVVVVAMEGETGSSNVAALMMECMPMWHLKFICAAPVEAAQ